jgi:hypothetical protein
MVAFDRSLVEEAKAIVAAALLEGPIMDLTRGVPCPTCAEEEGFARLSDAEVNHIGKEATSKVFRLLWLRDNEPENYRTKLGRSARADSDSRLGA